MKFDQELFSLVKAGTQGFVLFSQPKSAYLYFTKRRIDLITGKSESFDLNILHGELKQIDVMKKHSKRVLHFYYEWGALLKGLPVSDEQPLVMDLEFKHKRPMKLDELEAAAPIKLTFARALSEKNYKKEFETIQSELQAGNCYQVNLTHTFSYHYKTDHLMSFFKVWSNPSKRGAFAHATHVPKLGLLLLSNSPECLWKISEKQIYSFPIKGTVKINGENIREAKQILKASEKDLGELNMITDLMRNDLTYLTGGIAHVLSVRKFMEVPGLMHTYSVVKADLPDKLSLYKLMEALFPGGSITGAPKKRVMQIIHALENYPRNIYCGSTVILDEKVKAASINIRTARIDSKEKMFYYGAGGGVTLLSKEHEEYQELLNKITSFVQLFAF